MAFGMAFLVLGTAILVGSRISQAIGWLCVGGAGLVLVGILGGLAVDEAIDVAGLVNLAGVVPLEIAFVALAVSLWRRAARVAHLTATIAPSSLDPATATR